MNHKTIVYLIAFLIFGILFTSCSRPKEVLSRKKMEKLMYDIYIAESIIENDLQNFDSPQKKEALINEVFQKNKITQAQWDSSLTWYSDRIDLYLRINDSVKNRLQREHKLLESQLNNQLLLEQRSAQQQGLSTFIPTNYTFDGTTNQNGFRFRFNSSDIEANMPQPTSEYTFRVFGITPSPTAVLKSFLMLEYKDTTIYRVNNISENGTYTHTINKYIGNDTIQNMIGFMRLQSRLKENQSIQLYNIKLGNNSDNSETIIPDAKESTAQNFEQITK